MVDLSYVLSQGAIAGFESGKWCDQWDILDRIILCLWEECTGEGEAEC